LRLKASLLLLAISLLLLLASNLVSIEASREVEVVKEAGFSFSSLHSPSFFHLLQAVDSGVLIGSPCNLTIVNTGNTTVRVNLTLSNGTTLSFTLPPGSYASATSENSDIYIGVLDPGNLSFEYKSSYKTLPYAYLAIPAIFLFFIGSIMLVLAVATYVYEKE